MMFKSWDASNLCKCAQKYNQRSDEFADFLQGRLQISIDLVAEEAVYFITGHAIKGFFLMKAKTTQLVGLLLMIQTIHLINLDYD